MSSSFGCKKVSRVGFLLCDCGLFTCKLAVSLEFSCCVTLSGVGVSLLSVKPSLISDPAPVILPVPKSDPIIPFK